jgi:hypothetical protein
VPRGRKDIVPADHAIAVLNQIGEQIEHLRLDVDYGRTRPQLAPVRVQDKVFKRKQQLVSSRPETTEPVLKANTLPIGQEINPASTPNQCALKAQTAEACHRRTVIKPKGATDVAFSPTHADRH